MIKGSWQVFWLVPDPTYLPILVRTVVKSDVGSFSILALFIMSPDGTLTATGIAPDLHRTSLLMARGANQNLREYIIFPSFGGLSVFGVLVRR